MNRVHIAAVAAVGLAIGGVAAVVTVGGNGGGADGGDRLELIVASADAAGKAGTAKAEFTFVVTMPGLGTVDAGGTAAMDFERQAMSMTMDLGDAQFGGFSAETRLVDGVMYLKMPAPASPPTPWIALDFGAIAGEDLLQSGLGTGTDLAQTLDYLRGAGDVVEVGPDTVRGVDTTHYRVTVDLARVPDATPEAQREFVEAAVEQLRAAVGDTTLPMDVWLDSDGLPRRLGYSMTLGGAAGTTGLPAMSMEISIDLFDYGQAVDIHAPPASEVTDVTDGLGGLAGLLRG